MPVSGHNVARVIQAAVRAAVLLLAMAFFPTAVQAVTVSGLYSVEVPVAGSSPAELQDGYVEGLRRVLVRISGSTDVLAREGVQEVLGKAESLLQAYQFLRGEDGQNRLQMTFGAVAVNQALASIEAPVWGANRPLTLVWAAVEDRGARRLLTQARVGEDAADDWRTELNRVARDRGLPIALPPASFQGDRRLLSEIWGQFTDRVRSAASDLPHDAMALVRIGRDGDQWRAGWVFDGMGLGGGEEAVTAASPEALVQALVDRWADRFARRYAVAAGDVGALPQVEIVLQGITGLVDYAEASRVLEGLTPVRSVGAARVRGDQLTLRATFTGELAQLKEYIALDPRFVPVTGEPVALPAAPDAASETSPAVAGPVSEGATGSTGDVEAFGYQALPAGDAEDAEQAFESLYQVLYYLWQTAPKTDDDQDA